MALLYYFIVIIVINYNTCDITFCDKTNLISVSFKYYSRPMYIDTLLRIFLWLCPLDNRIFTPSYYR